MNECNAVRLRLKSELTPVAVKLHEELQDAFWRYSDLVGYVSAASVVLDLIQDLRKDFIHEDPTD